MRKNPNYTDNNGTIFFKALELKDFSPTWPENSFKQKRHYLIWISFNTLQAKVHIDSSIDFENLIEAFQSKLLSNSVQGKD